MVKKKKAQRIYSGDLRDSSVTHNLCDTGQIRFLTRK